MDKKDNVQKTKNRRIIKLARIFPADSSQIQEQAHQSVEEHQNRRGHSRSHLQEVIPHWNNPPKFYWLPKIHKTAVPLMPIILAGGL